MKYREHFLVRSVVAICALFVLSGCISSSHDISADLNQVYPVASSEYSAGSTTYSIIKTMEGYDSFFSGTNAPSNRSSLRFFRIREYNGLVLQYGVNPKKSGFLYAFVQTDGKNVTFYPTPTASGVKQLVAANYLNNLVKKDDLVSPPGYTPPTISPVHPARDTVRVLREIARRKIGLRQETLTKSVVASVPTAVEAGGDCAGDSVEAAFCRNSILKIKNREMIAGYRLVAERLPSHALAQLRAAQDAWQQELSACAGRPDVEECVSRLYDIRIAELRGPLRRGNPKGRAKAL